MNSEILKQFLSAERLSAYEDIVRNKDLPTSATTELYKLNSLISNEFLTLISYKSVCNHIILRQKLSLGFRRNSANGFYLSIGLICCIIN